LAAWRADFFSFLFLCPVTSPLLGARRIFFGRFCTALSARAPESFIWSLSGRILLRAQNLFSVMSGQQLLCMQNFFFSLFGHFCTVRLGAMLQIFFLLLTAMHACQGRQRFFFCPVASGQQQLRAQFFLSQPHSTAVCAAFCSCDRSLCHPRSKETIFLSLPCSSVRDTGRAELFFCAFLFLLPSDLICADTWF
jgi:hypothetical protein